MESLSAYEKFILAYLWYEYGGSLYFSRGSEDPELFLAKLITNELVKGTKPYFYDRLLQNLVNSFKRLKENWMIELSGYEVNLTIYGRQIVQGIGKEEYEKIKKKLASGKS